MSSSWGTSFLSGHNLSGTYQDTMESSELSFSCVKIYYLPLCDRQIVNINKYNKYMEAS